MGHFTFEEMNLMCIYNTGTRAGLMESLTEMRGYPLSLPAVLRAGGVCFVPECQCQPDSCAILR